MIDVQRRKRRIFEVAVVADEHIFPKVFRERIVKLEHSSEVLVYRRLFKRIGCEKLAQYLVIFYLFGIHTTLSIYYIAQAGGSRTP